MLKAISQFEELSTIYGQIVSENHNEIIKENITDLENSFANYSILLKELENCISTYKESHNSLQRIMFPYVRRMALKAKNKRDYI